MSEIVRDYVAKGMDYDELKRENDHLRAEKRTLIRDREEHTELVEYVEHERRLDQQREERREAPVWRRAKWWLFGAPSTDD